MALSINDACVNCWACLPLCPSNAITANLDGAAHFAIDAKKCTECDGDFATPQCASICPIEGAILDAVGEALNPPGSLTGIPPELLEQAMAEIQAR
ncbi:MAG: 4Fe-4S dicluster domain-containing protein [Hyphomicrobiaceae bacterium]|nr:4Fe-4S dicluster domain-containing protein [Hyphomicrobiaceae bacterium]